MIILPTSVLDARRRLLEQIDDETITEEQAFEQALALDPYDSVARLALGNARRQAGDLTAAEQYYWLALEASPCEYEPYFALSQLLMSGDENSMLAKGLFELALRKMLANEETLSDFESNRPEWEREHPGETYELGNRESLEATVTALTEHRTLEPRGVTDRLRPYRLIHELQASPAGGLDRQLVDRILEEGEACWPLLMGVLRGWWHEELPEDEDLPAVASLALLGEIGNPAALPALA
jgi:tetratricopeptide (TPR) repeat protein